MRRVMTVDVEYLKETNINLRQEIIILGLLLMLNEQVDCWNVMSSITQRDKFYLVKLSEIHQLTTA